MSALGKARGMLQGLTEVEGVRETLQRTSLFAIAKALGLKESDLTIDTEDYPTWDERERLRIGPEADF